ncbi:hypothetical protein YSY43_11020 [Paenibacillus sp. YSY-4.3]
MSRVDDEIMELRERIVRLEEQVRQYQEAPARGGYVRWFLTGFLVVIGLMAAGLVSLVVIQFAFW